MSNLIKILIIVFLLFFTNQNFGQDYSVSFDSITKINLKTIPKKHLKHFNSIINNSLRDSVLFRVDSLKSDYVFIEETYDISNNKLYVSERYFKSNDSIPKYLVYNGKYKKPEEEYNGFLIWYSKNITFQYTLLPLINKHINLKPFQVLPYEKTQIWKHGCVVNKFDKVKFRIKKEKELKNTYQIQTMIDKKNKLLIVSFQKPPVNPNFEVRGYNGVWDW